MSDFLTNLARRAIGDAADALVSPSPGAALANQLALPLTTAPSPAAPEIGAIPSAAATTVMRQAAPPAAAPAAPHPVAAPPAPAMPQPAARPDLSAPATRATAPQPERTASPAAAPIAESPRWPPIEPTAFADAVDRTVPARTPGEPLVDRPFAPAIDVESRLVQSNAPPLAQPSAPYGESTPETIRIEPAMRPAVMEPPLRPRGAAPTFDPLRAEPVTLRVPASGADEHRAAASSPTTSDRRAQPDPLERASIAPRLDEPRSAPVAAPVAEPRAASAHERAPVVGPRRTVEIRIGAIEVRVTPPAPGPAAERPSLAGFDEYAGWRNPVHSSDY